ncbi:MAG TPA: ubiquinol oxidase subunit II [Acetobacteraceae bacterium]|nr:ubiquinol oxidase subunit II [Acetobacteraceae bacterium]
MTTKLRRGLTSIARLAPAILLSGCNLDVLSPRGSVGQAEKALILTSTWAMLLVIVPVIILTLYFAWKYRASNTGAAYWPKWSHSTAIEVVVWGAPTLIIIFLANLTWKTTHELDPYKPLVSNVKPINVEVVALDWKWLFIYPDLGVASVNELAMPVNTPVNFVLTSDSVMNSFFIPRLGTQVYAMAGMQTQVHLIANEAGDYLGESANFSGRGFSDMQFRTLASSEADFQAWVDKVRHSQGQLDTATYAALAVQSEKNPVAYYSHVDGGLFDGIVAKYNNGRVMHRICRTSGLEG